MGGAFADKKEKEKGEQLLGKCLAEVAPSSFVCIKGIHCHLQRKTWGKENVLY